MNRSQSTLSIAMNPNGPKLITQRSTQNIHSSRVNVSSSLTANDQPKSLNNLSNGSIVLDQGQAGSTILNGDNQSKRLISEPSNGNLINPALPRPKTSSRQLPKIALTLEMDQFDIDNFHNIQLVPEYAKEIMNYTKKTEVGASFLSMKN